MGFDRIGAKLSARASIANNRPNPLLVTLVYLLAVNAVSGIAEWLIGDPGTTVMTYLEMGYEWEETIDYVFLRNPGATAIFLVVTAVLGIYRMVMDYGYTGYALAMAREKQPGFTRIFDGFTRFLRVVGASLLREALVLGWSLLYLLPALALFFVVMTLARELEIILFVYFLLAGVAGAVTVLVALRYRLTYYFLLEDPACTAVEAIRRSRAAMKGRSMELLALDLSFLPWTLLMFVTAGVAGVWVLPYEEATYANYYDYVMAQQTPGEGGYTGRIYGSGREDAPGPF